MTRSAPVFGGQLLAATIFTPKTDAERLVVTFGHRTSTPGRLDPPRPSGRFVRAGWAHLHIQTRWNDWYVNPETAALCAALAPVVRPFAHVAGIGFSMGAYGALRFSAVLNMAEAVLVSPLYSIHPGTVSFDRRFQVDAAGFDPVVGDLARHARRDLRGIAIFDPFNPRDAGHAALIASLLPDVHLCRFGFGGHPATAVLRETVKFGAVQDLVLQGTASRARVVALHRANRASSPSWWRALARLAAHTGRPALAAIAQTRASSLDAVGDSS